MASIDLPRALEDYFAFAETEPTRNGRRFSITLPYIGADGRLDRLQWWYHLSSAREQVMGESVLERLRTDALERFQLHIERWLQNTGQVLYGHGIIPQVRTQGAPAQPNIPVAEPTDTPDSAAASAAVPAAEVPAAELQSDAIRSPGKTAYG